MRAHYLQHVPFEGLGSIEPWLQKRGYEISCTRLFMGEQLPKLEKIDLVIVLGGPMSVNDEVEYPLLAAEKRFIHTVIIAEKPVLGVCLGAQLIASSMKAEVFPNATTEIGWFPLHSVNSAGDSVFQFPEGVLAFHWHGETFNLPHGAVLLASSSDCANQAFQLGKNVIGLQFHLETTPDAVRALVDNCRHELVDGRTIQREEEISAETQHTYSRKNSLMERVLEYLVANSYREVTGQDDS